MAECGLYVIPSQIKVKFGQMIQGRMTRFKNGIPGALWWKWFRHRHPKLSIRTPQGLEQGRARRLNPNSTTRFYENLEKIYNKYSYSVAKIWNLDESGAQANKNGLGKVPARNGGRKVHAVIPNEREWLTVLTTINAAREYLPNFYIFKGKRKTREYVARYEDGALWAMQSKD